MRSKASRGEHPRRHAKIYQAVILPQLLYSGTAWFSRTIGSPCFKSVLQLLINSRAFKGTAAAALDVELYLQPMELPMEQMVGTAI
jgi:hypothetical protein